MWALYFLEQAYLYGVGHDKNTGQAAGIDSYLMTHDDGIAMFRSIGADNEDTVNRVNAMIAIRDQLVKDSATHTEQRCQVVGGQPGGPPKQTVCHDVQIPNSK